MKSIEQRLYESYRAGRGIRLSAVDVLVLFRDDAIGTRITNQACREAHADSPGQDCVPVACIPTWRGFVQGFCDEPPKPKQMELLP